MDRLEYRPVRNGDADALGVFFQALRAAGDENWFHPHPLTLDEAERLCALRDRDQYLIASHGPKVVAYGLLRGWEEGYAIPSLGVAVHPECRGAGLGRSFMLYLHSVAFLRGAPRIRLKVYASNHRARALYEQLGYQFAAQPEGGQYVGILEARAATRAAG